MKWPRYPSYKPSGIEWLGEVPEHWASTRLKGVASYRVSNVDKVVAKDELPVRLCNYTDVYNHEQVRPSLDLMEATATANEIDRFGLEVGDVVITKDSEDWRDIGVPALVFESAPDLVCGYHLAIIRAQRSRVFSPFLLRVLQATAVNQQFQVAATGVTRYGLPKSAIGETWIPLPPKAEQEAIADILDWETARIDTLVAKKGALIERLEEKRTALISLAVTRGLPPDAACEAALDPHPRLKPSGFEWFGAVPEHWDVPPLYTRYEVDLGKMLDEKRITGKYLVPYLRNIDVQWDRLSVSDLPEMDILPSECERFTVKKGDILVCEGGEVGRAAIVGDQASGLGYQKALHRLRPRRSGEVPRFMFYTLCWATSQGTFVAGANPNTIPHLTGEKLRRYRFPTPPAAEQRAIAEFLDDASCSTDAMTTKIATAIDRLQEYRAALITAAVTGRIDVRQPTGCLPEPASKAKPARMEA